MVNVAGFETINQEMQICYVWLPIQWVLSKQALNQYLFPEAVQHEGIQISGGPLGYLNDVGKAS